MLVKFCKSDIIQQRSVKGSLYKMLVYNSFKRYF